MVPYGPPPCKAPVHIQHPDHGMRSYLLEKRFAKGRVFISMHRLLLLAHRLDAVEIHSKIDFIDDFCLSETVALGGAHRLHSSGHQVRQEYKLSVDRKSVV